MSLREEQLARLREASARMALDFADSLALQVLRELSAEGRRKGPHVLDRERAMMEAARQHGV